MRFKILKMWEKVAVVQDINDGFLHYIYLDAADYEVENEYIIVKNWDELRQNWEKMS